MSQQQVVERYSWIKGEDASSGRLAVAGPASMGRREGTEQRLSQLTRTIEVEVIPRLVLARRAAAECGPAPAIVVSPPLVLDVGEFTGIILARDAAAACSYAEDMRARGSSVEDLYLDLLAPTARRLGDLWTADSVDFVEVTIGLGRLQQVLREFSPAFHGEVVARSHGRRILMVPAAGEQHTFGLVMVSEFFRRAGWSVWRGLGETNDELVDLVRHEWFAVVGFSVGCETRLDVLAAAIRAVRRASRNRAIGVMVGGPIFVEHPELVAMVGADTTAADARQAALQAENLLTLLTRLG